MEEKKATYAAGCFWGIEETFRTLPGVLSTRVGYTGGHTEHPSYKEVCSGETGHAEAVEVTYDPDQVSYEELLKTFWSIHDPTQVNRQGPDVGTQYRSAIFFHSTAQKAAATASLQQHFKATDIATSIEPAEIFWQAEDYHQQYIAKGGANACSI